MSSRTAGQHAKGDKTIRILPEFSYRFIRFGMSGVVTTGVAYIVFTLLLSVMHYGLAMTVAWGLSVLTGFALNRNFTFQAADRAAKRQLALYTVGILLQLGVAIVGYGILAGRIGLGPTPAFFCNLIMTTSFSFVFMNCVVFRKPAIHRAR